MFYSPFRPDRLWGPLSFLSSGYRALFRGVKRQDCEVDHSPPASAEVNKTWIYTSTPPIRLHGIVLNLLNTGTTLPYFILVVLLSPSKRVPGQWLEVDNDLFIYCFFSQDHSDISIDANTLRSSCSGIT
jgi:hypothetical protein